MSRFVTSAARPSGLALALFLLPAASTVAAEPAFDLAAVVVTATRQATRANEVIADITVIDREAIEQAGPTTLPTLLSRQPGLHVIENGGVGKNASVFLRGTGSGHTLLLVDGVPLGSVTSGNPSLQNLPLSQIERIEILRGPASSLYGSDAIGGVIQVFTRRGEGEARASAYAGIGSHATRELQAGISGGSSGWSYSLGLSRMTTDGVNVAADPVRYRIANGAVPNADADGYGNGALSARLAYSLAPGHELGATLLEAVSRNAFDGGGVAVDAYNRDKTLARSAYLRNRLNAIWTSTLRWGLSEDNSSSFAPARSQFATTQNQWTWQNELQLPVGALLLALENTDQAVTSTTNYAVKNRNVRSVVIGYQGLIGAHSWQAAARYDRNSQFGGRRTGSLGYGYRFAAEWQARVSVGTAFKAPSFNQLYFPGFGSATLQPESARNREAALGWERGLRHASLTVYDNQIDNLIAGTVAAVNIGKARISGTSLAYGSRTGAWTSDASLDLMRPVDAGNGNRLQRRPAQMLKLALSYSPGAWKVGAEATAIGRRYDTTTQTRAMGGYAIGNLHAAREIDPSWSLEVRLNNVFNRVYENAWSYAVPDRQLFLGLRYAPK
ncbi:MAG: TonB-dependent receptor [Rhodocyclales bacterium]|nr:TonB-dependent receptor [Rhodocyclales bacterium]